MEGKNKKKNKKKKGNQNKLTEDVAWKNEGTFIQEQVNGMGTEQNDQPHSASNADAQSVGVSESDMESERQKSYETKCTMLEREVRKLENERNSWLKVEASLEAKIRNLHNEVETCVQNEARLEENLSSLLAKKDSLWQKQGLLADKIKQIEDMTDLWNLKEVKRKLPRFYQRHIELVDQRHLFHFNERKDFEVEEVNQGLQMQVKELGECKNSLIQDNQKLVESISQLELRIEHLQKGSNYIKPSAELIEHMPGEVNMLDQLEATNSEMEKHVGSIEDVEKGSELNNKQESPATNQKDSSSNQPKQNDFSITQQEHATEPVISSSTDYLMQYNERSYPFKEKMQPMVNDNGIYSVRNGMEGFTPGNRLLPGQPLLLDEPRISEEIVQIPLDDAQVQEEQPQAIKSDEIKPVPLTDAPLIGAPFRLFLFVAKYVNGADLVNRTSSTAPK